VEATINLNVKLKKTIQIKKKEFENEDHAASLLNPDSWKFGMNEFELVDYPHGTKKVFDVKENPVLWVRVDPDMEFIRKVKVVQSEQNWLLQLLQERDILGQIEAVRALKKFNNELTYEILQRRVTDENYFFKVRKECLKAIVQMRTREINQCKLPRVNAARHLEREGPYQDVQPAELLGQSGLLPAQ